VEVILAQMAVAANVAVRPEMRAAVKARGEPDGGPEGDVKKQQPDLVLVMPSVRGGGGGAERTIYVDVLVGDVAVYPREAEVEEGVVKMLEERKMRHYAAFMAERPNGEFVPAAATSTGQLGPQVLKLIEGLVRVGGGRRKVSRRWWLSRLSMVFVRYAYEMYSHWVSECNKWLGRHRAVTMSTVKSELAVARSLVEEVSQDQQLLADE
jgi:hypothetical protein